MTQLADAQHRPREHLVEQQALLVRADARLRPEAEIDIFVAPERFRIRGVTRGCGCLRFVEGFERQMRRDGAVRERQRERRQQDDGGCHQQMLRHL